MHLRLAVLPGLAADCAMGLLHHLILPAGLAGHRKPLDHGGGPSLQTTRAATEAWAQKIPCSLLRRWCKEQPGLQQPFSRCVFCLGQGL